MRKKLRSDVKAACRRFRSNWRHGEYRMLRFCLKLVGVRSRLSFADAWYVPCVVRYMRQLRQNTSCSLSAMTPVILAAGFCAACPAFAQRIADDGTQEGVADATNPAADGTRGDATMHRASAVGGMAVAAGMYRKGHALTSGYSRKPVAGRAYGYLLGGDDRVLSDAELRGYWLDSLRRGRQAITVGYAWRDLRVENTRLLAPSSDPPGPARDARFRIGPDASRLSFQPSQHWTLRLSHGMLGDLDQFEPNERIRRSAVSATYSRAILEGVWQTTLAWGRSVRRSSEPVRGFLIESNFRFLRTHAIFGRLEQVGSDDLARENTGLQQQFKMGKLTIGYFHHIETLTSIGIDVGGFASRRLVPSAMASSYSNNPTAYMVFIRLKLD
jgi:hypothetical protein